MKKILIFPPLQPIVFQTIVKATDENFFDRKFGATARDFVTLHRRLALRQRGDKTDNISTGTHAGTGRRRDRGWWKSEVESEQGRAEA